MPSAEKFKSSLRSFAAGALHHSKLLSLKNPEWKILMYHRILDPSELHYPVQAGMYVKPETFQMQMEFLSRNANVISLETLLAHLDDNNPPPKKTVVLSFDDGWADNYTNAFSVLKDFGLPASIFLATSFINSSKWFWTDRLALIISTLRSEAKRREAISARIFENDSISVTSASSLVEIITEGSDSDINQTVETAIELLKLRLIPERNAVIKTLTRVAKDFSSLVQDRVFLNWDEIKEMQNHGISFGSHTHTHQPLSKLEAPQICDELDNAKQLLRAHIQNPSSCFCYPGGDYNELSQSILAEKNYKYALGVARASEMDIEPNILGRIGIHQDISSSQALFASRIWGGAF